MEVFLKGLVSMVAVGYAVGFNPCFNGSVPESVKQALEDSVEIGFNPCFNGSVPERIIRNTQATTDNQVSILVLMEVFLKVPELLSQYFRALRFNPCFNGSVPERNFFFPDLFWLIQFQSLF